MVNNNNNNNRKKLNSSAKAFVPQASTASWKPSNKSKDKGRNDNNKNAAGGGDNSASSSWRKPKAQDKKNSKPSDEAPTEVVKQHESGGGGGKVKATETPSKPVKPVTSTVEETSAPIPVVNVWGKKQSNAIRAAPSAQHDKKKQQSSYQRNNQNQQQQNNRRDHKDQDNNFSNDGGGWRNRGGNQRHQSGNQRQQSGNQRQQSGGSSNSGGPSNGGSWRSVGKIQRGGENVKRQNSSGAGGGGRRGNNYNDENDRSGGGSNDGWQRGKSLPMDLLKPGEGDTDAHKKVQRIRLDELLVLRLSYLAPPLSWENSDESKPSGPPEVCRWIADERISEIDAMTKNSRLGGDVSQHRRKKKETAPPLEECKPLEVNEGTRWKAKVFNKGDTVDDDEDSNEVILKKSLLILNKLSLTKFDKLSDAFIQTGIGRNEECLNGAIELIVKKAQDEPHFSAMYALLCSKLSSTPMEFEEGLPKKGKRFKKMLLAACQKEFETKTEDKIAEATKDIDEEEERAYKSSIVKKHYLGHMTLIGELFKGNLISIKIMLLCLPELLKPPSSEDTTSTATKEVVDEEKVECFVKLMSTIGLNLEQQSQEMMNKGKGDAAEQLEKCWNTVHLYATERKDQKVEISNRIKFMLQDLLEMRQKGWVKRREEETAKTIDEIHKEARNEARRSASSGNLTNMRRQSSSSDMRRSNRRSAAPSIDADGFTEVSTTSTGFSRSQSLGNFKRNSSSSDSLLIRRSVSGGSSKERDQFKRSSSGSSFAALNESRTTDRHSGSKKDDGINNDNDESTRSSLEKIKIAETPKCKSPDECGTKAQNILKEYFVGGDTDDAVLSFKELIGVGDEGSVDRGAKVVEKGILLVMEMKQTEVNKFLEVVTRTFKANELEAASIVAGMNDPLEFLQDIMIDAPLATGHLVTICSEFIKTGCVSFDFLLGAPEYFRTDCGSATFGCKVLKKLGGDALDSTENLEVIEKLMTDNDKDTFQNAKDFLAA